MRSFISFLYCIKNFSIQHVCFHICLICFVINLKGIINTIVGFWIFLLSFPYCLFC
nr:MAG TPA: hypothetical protein [Caudoviricetes sp.]